MAKARSKKDSPSLSARNENQALYLNHIRTKTAIFALGPAGTGKTYLATRYAAGLFKSKDIDKIIITRPMVSAEEEFGILPGEIEDKFAPFFLPLREILAIDLGYGTIDYEVKSRKIELAPVAFLRGRTFDNAFIILDEAQNMTPKQMQLFLTRVGENSTVCLCGDLNQMDIDGPSGLEDAFDRIYDLPEVGVVEFTEDDCVRSGFVKKVLSRYK